MFRIIEWIPSFTRYLGERELNSATPKAGAWEPDVMNGPGVAHDSTRIAAPEFRWFNSPMELLADHAHADASPWVMGMFVVIMLLTYVGVAHEGIHKTVAALLQSELKRSSC